MPGVHTVIVPTFDRPQDVQDLLGDLGAQTRRPDKVIVSDDSRDDRVEQVVRAFAGPFPVEYVRNEGPPSLTRARNRAKADVHDGLVTMLDSDVRLAPDYLEEVRALVVRRPEAAGWMGWVTDYPRGSTWKNLATKVLCISHARAHQARLFFPMHLSYPIRPTGDLPADYLYGCNMTFRAEDARAIDFDPTFERYGYAEDIDFSIRLRQATGKGFWLTPKAKMGHRRTEEGRLPQPDYFRMRFLHKHILAHRYYRLGPLRRAKLWWSDWGAVLYYSRLWPECAPIVRAARRTVRAALHARPHALRRGDTHAFLDLFSFADKA